MAAQRGLDARWYEAHLKGRLVPLARVRSGCSGISAYDGIVRKTGVNLDPPGTVPGEGFVGCVGADGRQLVFAESATVVPLPSTKLKKER
jgi:hypothetical protein